MPVLKRSRHRELGHGVRAIGQHSSATDDWGTEPRIVRLMRSVLGRIDVDPASSLKWNEIIGAERIITKRQDGRTTPWVEGAPAPNKLVAQRRRQKPLDQRAFVNGPGDPSGENIATYWRALAGYYELGWLSCGGWIGFSVEQVSRLQRVGAASHPLEHVTCIPDTRRKYSIRPGVPGNQPGHASFITLLPDSRAMVQRFVDAFSELGHVIVGERWRR